MDEARQLTDLLRAHHDGDRKAFDALVPFVYQRLRGIAHGQLRRGGRGTALDTTALVHEAYVQLVDETGVEWQNRSHFFAVCARAMRRILVDYARQRTAKKRGGDQDDATLPFDLAAGDRDRAELVVAVDEALAKLADFNERLVRVVECRFFAGMTAGETANVLETSQRTVERDWQRARAWLCQELG